MHWMSRRDRRIVGLMTSRHLELSVSCTASPTRPVARPALSRRRTLLAVLALALALFAAALGAACAPIGAIRVVTRPPAAEPHRYEPWDRILAAPTALRVTAFVTGWVEAGPEILIEASEQRVPDRYRQRMWVPSVAYLVEHPTHGRVLLDTGLRAGECAYGLPPFYWVPCRSHPGADLLSQLRARGIDPRSIGHVVISHFHGDHASGLAGLLAAGVGRVVTTQSEIAALETPLREAAGYPSAFFDRPMDVELVDAHVTTMPIVGRAVDFWGDGSLWLIPTSGHSAGHLSALINARDAPLLLTFDVAHLGAGFDLDVPPGWRVDDHDARDALTRLRALAARHPELRVIFGHEPSQWEGRGDAVLLAGRE
jgi:N-acyl homoserine lactone hydrolase